MDIELKLVAEITGALKGLESLKNDFSNLQDVTKQVQTSLTDAFKKPGTALNTLVNQIKPVAGSLLDLQQRMARLKDEAANIDVASERFKELNREIVKTRDEIGIATGKFDEFGQRIKKGAGESIANVFEVGEAVVGIFNLAALTGFGEKVGKESELAERAIKGLVVLQSLHAAGAGILKAQELALDVVERGRNATMAISAFAQKAYNLALAVYTGEVTLAAAATRAWGVALAFATGPIGLSIAALGAIIGAIVLFTDAEKDNTEAMIENAKATAEATKARNDLLNKIDELRTQIAVETGELKKGDAERINITKEFFREREVLEQEHAAKLIELRKGADLESEEGLKDYRQARDKSEEEFNDSQEKRYLAFKTKIRLVEIQSANELKDEAEKDKEKRTELEKQRNDKLLQLRKALTDALLDLENKSNKATLSTLTGQEAITLEAQLANKEVDRLREAIIAKGKLVDENFKLSSEQENQLSILRFAIAQDYQKKTNQLIIDNQQQRNSLIRDAQERELAEFKTGWIKKEQELLDAGSKEEDIARAKNQAILEINQKYVQEDLSIVEQIETNRIDAAQRGFESETEFERRKAALKLQLQIQIKQAQIQNLALDPEANRLNISNLEAEILKARADLEKIGKEQDPITLTSLLGLDKTLSTEEVASVNEAFGSLAQSLQTIGEQAIEFRKKQLEEDANLNQGMIDNLNRRIEEEERALDREIQARDKGYAANVEGSKKTLAELKRQRDKELEEKKRIQDEERKLAKQAALIQAIVQAANLATAGAQLFQKSVEQSGPAGVIVAIAAIAAMVAGFISLVAQIKSATSFGKGGWIEGPSHEQNGVTINAEGGEFVTRKRVASKHRAILEGMNSEDMSRVKPIDIMNLLAGTGVTMSAQDIEPTITRGQEISERAGAVPAERANQIEQRMISLDETVKKIKLKMIDQERYTDANGNQVIRKGNHTVILRKNEV